MNCFDGKVVQVILYWTKIIFKGRKIRIKFKKKTGDMNNKKKGKIKLKG